MNIDKVGSIRRTLDRLRPSEVTWDPYVNYSDNGVVHAMAFYSDTLTYMDVVEPYHQERIVTVWPRAIYTRSFVPPIGSTSRPICTQILGQVWVPTRQLGTWRNHLLAPEVRGDKAEFEFLATLDYLPWFLKVSHPVITNPSYFDEDMVATTIADNELLEVLNVL
ncbi:hypothetical protein Scep_007177 [Stephania cephalantha]|uniref:Uncharacterized protein n=1 Tax=Stephania cephalantha TaxID=152367 RepID=A0AAP0PNK8_9MAGN